MINQERFAFGANWARFLSVVDQSRAEAAETSLKELLSVEDLSGARFLDVGSGSGLFSLSACKAGAIVRSFDFDPQSVSCALELRKRFCPEDRSWDIEQGSALDEEFLEALGKFEIVYSWGVLHHTGDMWKAMDNVSRLVGENGLLCVALYNDQGWRSRVWTVIKRGYNRVPILRPVFLGLFAPYFVGLRMLVRAVSGRIRLERGMSYWHDMVDWVGGFPFEVARAGEVVDFYVERGFLLQKLRTCGGRSGCNEFVFKKTKAP